MLNLPSVIWNLIFQFLDFFDVLNLLYSHKKFSYIIDETTFKFYFDNMDNIFSEEVWRMFLKQNFEVLIKEDYLFFNEQVFSEEVQKTLSLY